jgi:hypothetical protein
MTPGRSPAGGTRSGNGPASPHRSAGTCTSWDPDLVVPRKGLAVDGELRGLVPALAPSLLQLPGCGVVVGRSHPRRDRRRAWFRSSDAFARFTGTAPVPVWWDPASARSASTRGGNLAMNRALHLIAITPGQWDRPGTRLPGTSRWAGAKTRPLPYDCSDANSPTPFHRPARRRDAVEDRTEHQRHRGA